MKQFSVCLLILLLFSTDNTFKEFLKAPFLIGHFRAHQQKDPSIGFLKFMSMHYFGKDLNDNDHNEDMKLPFKKISHAAHQVLWPSPSSITSLPKLSYTITPTHSYKKILFQSTGCNQLYRPPQSRFLYSC